MSFLGDIFSRNSGGGKDWFTKVYNFDGKFAKRFVAFGSNNRPRQTANLLGYVGRYCTYHVLIHNWCDFSTVFLE